MLATTTTRLSGLCRIGAVALRGRSSRARSMPTPAHGG